MFIAVSQLLLKKTKPHTKTTKSHWTTTADSFFITEMQVGLTSVQIPSLKIGEAGKRIFLLLDTIQSLKCM